MFIYAHNENSQGANNLAKELKVKRIKHEKSAFVGASTKTVINWGSSTIPPEVAKCRVLNHPTVLKKCTDKLRFFKKMYEAEGGPRIPKFTSSATQAAQWVLEEGKVIVARTILNGSGGAGIKFIEANKPNSFVQAPLYVEYVKKKDEYRVHFVGNKIVDYQRKALRQGAPNPDNVNWRVRNLENGFVYIRGGVELPDDVKLQAERTIAAAGLDFGAIDIIYNAEQNKAYVLEVNTAPGLQGETVTTYANAFNELYA